MGWQAGTPSPGLCCFCPQSAPQRLKPPGHFLGILSARLKSCPDTERLGEFVESHPCAKSSARMGHPALNRAVNFFAIPPIPQRARNGWGTRPGIDGAAQRNKNGQALRPVRLYSIRLLVESFDYGCAGTPWVPEFRAIAFSVRTLCAVSSRAWASGRKVTAF